jgi:hypothetical protein
MSEWRYCIKMRETSWELALDAPLGLSESPVHHHLRPNVHLRAKLDHLIGEGRWIRQRR